ncbi:DNA-binding protein [Klebsiella aerogenes]|uniref:DNA-binding protein n=1 Tax=Klebsiella aerogenes TaxID=548 RepID=A0AAP9R1X1_KLEAE|nr:DNA-binding protein [Klebsiella aerogenes]QMR43081.1 DNA-binding protein [Klebsiella aerogenes]
MRPATFEPAVIIEAGLALQAEGRKITGFALRGRIGGGNPARLKQIWEEYQASQAQVNAEPVAELPVEVAEEVKLVTQALAERISQLATELNDKAVRAAERRVAEITRAAGEQMAQAESELADAAQTVEDLETRFDDLQDEHQRTEELLTRSRSSEQAQAVELAQLNERLSALSRQQADWQQRLEEAGQQLTAATARHEAETQGLVQRHEKESSELTARYEQQLAVADSHHQESASRHTEELRTLNDQHQQRVSELSQQLQSAKQALLTQAKKHDAALLSLGQKHDAETGRLEKSRDTAVREAQTAREEKAALAGELQALRAQNNQLTALLAGKKAP